MEFTRFTVGLVVGFLLASFVGVCVGAVLYDRARDEAAVLKFELEQYKQLHAYYAEKTR